MAEEHEQRFVAEAERRLKGRKVAAVRYMTVEEARDMGWFSRPLVIFLDDGSYLFAQRDDEGNDGGALAFGTEAGEGDTFPVMR